MMFIVGFGFGVLACVIYDQFFRGKLWHWLTDGKPPAPKPEKKPKKRIGTIDRVFTGTGPGNKGHEYHVRLVVEERETVGSLSKIEIIEVQGVSDQGLRASVERMIGNFVETSAVKWHGAHEGVGPK